MGFDNVEEVAKVTGIRAVRQAAKDKTAADYCTSAAEHLFEALNFDKSQIDGIVFMTPDIDYLTPGDGYLVQARLNLSTKCVIVDVNQACAGYVNGLFQAFLLVQSGYCKNVLLCAGVTPTKTTNPKDKSLRTLMSDAGSATIISAGDGNSRSAFTFFNDGKGATKLYIPAGGKKIPVKAGETDKEIADAHGNIRSLENLYMDGLEVMIFVMDAAPYTINGVLKNIGWKKDEVELFALHQASEVILKTLCKRLRIPPEKVPIQLENFGNTGLASVPLTLCVENPNAVSRWGKTVISGFGNGLACATAALDLSEAYFCELHEL